MTFELPRDRRRIQVALNLPTSQLDPNSDLARRMDAVEERDAEFGMEVAAEILSYLAEMEKLIEEINRTYLDGTGAASQRAIRVDEYSETIGVGLGSGRTIGSGFQERVNWFVNAIRRDLGYGVGAAGGVIPVM